MSLITKAMTRYRLKSRISIGMESLIPEMKQKHLHLLSLIIMVHLLV